MRVQTNKCKQLAGWAKVDGTIPTENVIPMAGIYPTTLENQSASASRYHKQKVCNQVLRLVASEHSLLVKC